MIARKKTMPLHTRTMMKPTSLASPRYMYDQRSNNSSSIAESSIRERIERFS